MKFLRTIRFDGSDDHVFAKAGMPDEWAISGAFVFSDMTGDELTGKTRQAFANGFLSLPSYGRTTFVTVAAITNSELGDVLAMLSDHFVDQWSAPDRHAAESAADDELKFMVELCADHPVNTIFTVSREIENGDIREQFRTVKPPSEATHSRIWDIVED